MGQGRAHIPARRMLKTHCWVNDWAGCSLAGGAWPTPSSGTPGGGAVKDASLREGGHGQKEIKGGAAGMRSMMGVGVGLCSAGRKAPRASRSSWYLAALWWGDQCPPKVHVHPEP